MYNSVYEEYINNMLGRYPNYTRMEAGNFENNNYQNTNFQNNSNNENLEKLYPELYKLIYPMIQSACMRNTKPITEETIDSMVKDIYDNFVSDDSTLININLTNDVRSTKNSEVQKNKDVISTNSSRPTQSNNNLKTKEVRKEDDETRQFRPNNFVLNDLIRILLIRELLGRPGNFLPNRPGIPGPAGRPPMRPTMRPPFNPREFNNQMPSGLHDRIFSAQPTDFYSEFEDGFNIF